MSKNKNNSVLAASLISLLMLGGCSYNANSGHSHKFVDTRYTPGKVYEVPLDRTLLASFTGKKRHLLLQYLASSAIWRVSNSEYWREITNARQETQWPNETVAGLRLTPSFFADESKRSYYANALSELEQNPSIMQSAICTERNTEDPKDRYSSREPKPAAPGLPLNWSIQILLAVKGDKDPIDSSAAIQKGNTASIKTSTFNGPGGGNSTDLEVFGPEVSIFIFEGSQSPDINLCKKALSFVEDELKKISAAIDKSPEIDESLLAAGSVRQNAADSIELKHNLISGYLNPGKEGMLRFRCAASGGMSMFPLLTGGSDETTICGWSNDKNQKFSLLFRFTSILGMDREQAIRRISSITN